MIELHKFISISLKVLKNQASFITNKLEMFEQTYLADGSGGGGASGSE